MFPYYYSLILIFKVKTKKSDRNIKKTLKKGSMPGNVLSSQALGLLFSPLKCLTSVFGMGTGVSTSPSSPVLSEVIPQNRITVRRVFLLD